jgi:hypothetical protein
MVEHDRCTAASGRGRGRPSSASQQDPETCASFGCTFCATALAANATLAHASPQQSACCAFPPFAPSRVASDKFKRFDVLWVLTGRIGASKSPVSNSEQSLRRTEEHNHSRCLLYLLGTLTHTEKYTKEASCVSSLMHFCRLMNPATYLREAERIERETASRISCERLQRPRLAYGREELASGCVLYLMRLGRWRQRIGGDSEWPTNRPELRGSGDRRRQPRLICFSDISRCLTFRCASLTARPRPGGPRRPVHLTRSNASASRTLH